MAFVPLPHTAVNKRCLMFVGVHREESAQQPATQLWLHEQLPPRYKAEKSVVHTQKRIVLLFRFGTSETRVKTRNRSPDHSSNGNCVLSICIVLCVCVCTSYQRDQTDRVYYYPSASYRIGWEDRKRLGSMRCMCCACFSSLSICVLCTG